MNNRDKIEKLLKLAAKQSVEDGLAYDSMSPQEYNEMLEEIDTFKEQLISDMDKMDTEIETLKAASKLLLSANEKYESIIKDLKGG